MFIFLQSFHYCGGAQEHRLTFRILPGYIRVSNERQTTETVWFNKHKCEIDVTFKQMTCVCTGARIIPNHHAPQLFSLHSCRGHQPHKDCLILPAPLFMGMLRLCNNQRYTALSSLINSCGNGGKYAHTVSSIPTVTSFED